MQEQPNNEASASQQGSNFEHGLLEAILESSGGVLVILDRQGRMVEVNAMVERLTGFRRDQLLGQPIWDWLIPPERMADVRDVFAELTKEAIPNEHENEWLTRDGGRIPFHWYNTVLRDADGQVSHVVAEGHDLSRTKANETIIRQDRERQTLLRALLDDSFRQGTLERILGRCLERLLGISWLAVLPKGGIFLVETEGEALRLLVSRGLSEEIQRDCAHLPFGRCVCGRAASHREIQFVPQVDVQHSVCHPGMRDHGHYCLPLLAGAGLLGVLVLYLPIGFVRDPVKEEFLLSVANILAGAIQRKLDEAGLLERDWMYSHVIEASLDGFWMTDGDGSLLEANAAYARLSGYSQQELRRMRIADLEALEAPEKVAAHIERIKEQGVDLFETRHRAKDGRIWPVEINVTYLPSSAGRFFVFLRDISQREELRQRLLRQGAELEQQVSARTAELEASQRQLAELVEHLPAILFIKDLVGNYTRVNRCYEREVGPSKSQVIGHTDRDIYPPDVAEAIIAMDRQVIAGGVPVTFEERVPQQDGTRHDYLTTKLPLRDEAGRPSALLGIAIDITPLKTLQERLAHAQAIAHLGSWQLDLHNGMLNWSDETYRIFGIPVGSPVRHADLVARIHPDDRDLTLRAWELATQGMPFDIECRILTGDQVKWLRARAEVRFSEQGAPLLASGSIQDITEVKQTQVALQGAVREAERLARVKSEFLANMSHEIRTPLNGILGLAQIGQRENLGRGSQRLFDQVLDSGKLLLGIVNDILDFSKIEAGKLRIETLDVRREHLIQHVSVMCSDRASDKGFLLRIEADDQVPAWFRGDPLRLAQILVNLVGNAIKFTERGEVVLSIHPEGEQILFRVRDTGIGMTPDQVENLFSPFEQADGSITRRFGGTGLGLAITKRLVDLMEGEIRVQSQPGVGSTFEVRLPLVEAQNPMESSSPPPSPGAPIPCRALAGLRILAAEDNPVNRMVLEDMLTLEGATLVCAEDGQQALDLVLRDGEAAWDILLTDIHMPVMSGHQLAQRLRELAPALPIIGVTAHALAEERQQCLASGMRDHVAKPIVLEELVRVVLRHARRQAVKVPVAEPAAEPTPGPGLAPATQRDEQQGPIDWAALLRQFQGRQSFVDKILRQLLTSHGETPARLRAALDAGDLEGLAFVAHSFAGVAGQVHAAGLRAQAKELELAARAGETDLRGRTEALAQQVDAFLDWLRGRLAPDAASTGQWIG